MRGHIYIKPAAELVVLDPLTAKPLPAEGGWVADTTYWHRRLADGDALPAQAPADDLIQNPPEAPLKVPASPQQNRSTK